MTSDSSTLGAAGRDPAAEFVLRCDRPEVVVMVSGYRYWEDAAAIEREMLKLPAQRVRIIHGDCPTGADAIADGIARRLGMRVDKFPADWAKYGRSAGPRRNTEMVDIADCLIAFPAPQSRGTVDAMEKAGKKGIPVTVIKGT